MIRVVLDTNVVVSGLLKTDGNERQVLRLALAGRFTLLLSDPIFAEYGGVLRRPKFKLATKDVAETLRHIREVATWIEPRATLDLSDDEADNRFLECTQAGEADYLVTGNAQHFPTTLGRARIINARHLVELLMPKP